MFVASGGVQLTDIPGSSVMCTDITKKKMSLDTLLFVAERLHVNWKQSMSGETVWSQAPNQHMWCAFNKSLHNCILYSLYSPLILSTAIEK